MLFPSLAKYRELFEKCYETMITKFLLTFIVKIYVKAQSPTIRKAQA
jgi:hypothetical protein